MSEQENDIESFFLRFDALAEEAKSYGIITLVGLCAYDPFAKGDEYHCLYKGGFTTALGMALRIQHDMMHSDPSDLRSEEPR